jgi:hypothetical protein
MLEQDRFKRMRYRMQLLSSIKHSLTNAMVKVTFKLATGAKFDMDVEGSMTVATLKDLIADLASVQPPNQRMVFKGQVHNPPFITRIQLLYGYGGRSAHCCNPSSTHFFPSRCASQVLKDPNTADSYGMADGDVVHIVTVSAPAGQAVPAAPAAAAAPSPAPAAAPAPHAPSADPFAALLGAAPNAGANPFAAMMGDMGGMGMPDMASMQAMMQQNPEMMAAMMDNPMVQQALDNPGKLSV